MDTHSGGWTLVMKAVDANFHYTSTAWTTDNTENPLDLDAGTPGTAKYQSFNEVAFDEIMTTDPDDYSTNFRQSFGSRQDSALALFSGSGLILSSTHSTYFNTRALERHRQWGCTTYGRYGFNLYESLGCGFIDTSWSCDYNGGARWGNRVNANHYGAGDLNGQGWGQYGCNLEGGMGSGSHDIRELMWVR
jgi:hypothetical protein